MVDRNLYVLIRDFEQEACFVLMLWALAIMAYKGGGGGASFLSVPETYHREATSRNQKVMSHWAR